MVILYQATSSLLSALLEPSKYSERDGFLLPIDEEIVAYTIPSNSASWRVLEKNQFVKDGSKIDSEDGEVLIWRKMR